MASVRGRFLSPSGQSYANHRVYLSFREPAQDVLRKLTFIGGGGEKEEEATESSSPEDS